MASRRPPPRGDFGVRMEGGPRSRPCEPPAPTCPGSRGGFPGSERGRAGPPGLHPAGRGCFTPGGHVGDGFGAGPCAPSRSIPFLSPSRGGAGGRRGGPQRPALPSSAQPGPRLGLLPPARLFPDRIALLCPEIGPTGRVYSAQGSGSGRRNQNKKQHCEKIVPRFLFVWDKNPGNGS